MNLVTIYDGPDACEKCLGWKRVANDDDQSSWKHWAELPPPSNLSVVLGLVYPVECPACHGSGRTAPAITDDQVKTAIAVLRAYVDGSLQTDLCDELDDAIIQAWDTWLSDHPDDEPGDYEIPLTQSW